MRNPRYTINIDADQKYFFRLHNEKNEIILTGEKCETKKECLHAIRMVRVLGDKDNFFERIYGLSTNRFIVKTSDEKLIGKSGQFQTTRLKEKTIEIIKTIAHIAPVYDLTE